MPLWSLLAATSASAAPATDDAFGVSFAGAPINDINISVSNVKQCDDAVISWSGTQGPVEVTIGTGGYYVGSTTLDTISGLQGDSTTWKVNLPAGSDTLIFQVKDSTRNLKYKQGVAIEKSSDSSCLEGGSSSSSASSASPVPSSSESEQTPEPSTSSTSTSDTDSASSSTSNHDTSPSAAPTPSTSEEPTPSSKSSIPEPVSSSGAGASPTSSGEDFSSSASLSSGDGSSPSPGGSSISSSPRGTSSVSPSDSGSSSSATEIPSSQTSGEASAPSAVFASSAVPVSVSSKSNLAAHTSQPIIENTSVPPASQETPKTQTTIVPAPAPVVPGSGSQGSADVAKPSTAAAPVVTETVSSAVPNAAQPAQPSAPSSSSTTSRSVVYVTSIRTNSSLNPAIQTATVVGDSKGASLSLQDSGASRSLTGATGVFAAALAVLAAAVL